MKVSQYRKNTAPLFFELHAVVDLNNVKISLGRAIDKTSNIMLNKPIVSVTYADTSTIMNIVTKCVVYGSF